MTRTIQDLSDLEQRIQDLEAALASMKQVVEARSVRAQSFVLATRNGTTRGWMAVNDSGMPEVKLTAKDGSVRAELVLDESAAPRLVMFDAAGRQRASVQVSETGEPSAHLWDNSGVNMIALRTTTTGECEIILNGGMKGRLRLGSHPEGATRIELLDESSQARVALRAGVERPAELLLLGGSGDPRAEIFLEANDATGLRLYDYHDSPRMTVGLNLVGGPSVELSDEDGSEVAALRPPSDDEEDDDSDDDDYSASAVSKALTRAARHLPPARDRRPGDSIVASLIYPTDLLDTWRVAVGHPRHKMQAYDHAFAFDNDVAIGVVGSARELSWISNHAFGGSTNRQSVALFVIVVNRSGQDITLLGVNKLVLIDDRGHQYSTTDAFSWTEGTGSFNTHASVVIGGARQEGFLLFPEMRAGSTRYVKAVLIDSFQVGADFAERKYVIPMNQ